MLVRPVGRPDERLLLGAVPGPPPGAGPLHPQHRGQAHRRREPQVGHLWTQEAVCRIRDFSSLFIFYRFR